MEPDPNSLHRVTLQLPVPVQDSKILLKLLQLELQAHPPNAPIKKVILTIEAAPSCKVQRELFIPPISTVSPRAGLGENLASLIEESDKHGLGIFQFHAGWYRRPKSPQR